MKPKLDNFADSERRWRQRQLFGSRRRSGVVGRLLLLLALIGAVVLTGYLLCRFDVAGLSVLCGSQPPAESVDPR